MTDEPPKDQPAAPGALFDQLRPNRLVMPPGCVDVTSQDLGTGLAVVGAEAFRRSRKTPSKDER